MSAPKFKRVLHVGMHGRDVSGVKIALGHAGFGRGYIAVHTRGFGPNMRTNLKHFQSHVGLKADGVYGPITHAKLGPHFSRYAAWLYNREPVTHPFTNPFPGGWTPNRLDQGYDGTFYGRVVAPFKGVITYAGYIGGASPWGGFVQIKSAVPTGLPQRSLYFAEGLKATVKVGQHVKKGQEIAVPAPSPYGNAYGTTANGVGQIEWGVATDGTLGSYTGPYAMKLGLGSTAARDMVLGFYRWARTKAGVPGKTTNPNGAGSA